MVRITFGRTVPFAETAGSRSRIEREMIIQHTRALLSALLITILVMAQPQVQPRTLASSLGMEAVPPEPYDSPKLALDLRAQVLAASKGTQIPIVVALHPIPRTIAPAAVDRAARARAVVAQLRAATTAAQQEILIWLQSKEVRDGVRDLRSFWIFNGLALTATPAVIQALVARNDVARVALDEVAIVPTGTPTAVRSDPASAANLSVIGVPELWELGITGQGIVVATVDTGVDETHPELIDRWRGGTNSWFDPYGEHPTDPTDLQGHGTWVTGVMVAGGDTGTALGVAPDAQWIGGKIFPDRGSPRPSAIHASFQWLLDPDGDPATADMPHVVVNAWSFANPGCDLEFQADLEALRAAGILPVFAAGNYGPNTGTDVSPANNPAAFAVGATDNADAIYLYSSRGPAACGEAPTIYPEMVAPGVRITTTERGGLYITETGTSLAAPHVAGALALLLSAYPHLSAETQASLLLNTAHDLGQSGPDNTFGYGRLDVRAAYEAYEPPPVYTLYLPFYVISPRSYAIYLPLVGRAP